MTEDTARAIVQAHEPELVEWAASDLTRRLKAKEKIPSPGGWLVRAIEEDWRPQPSLFAQKQTQARQTERQAEREQEDRQVKTAEGRKADAAHEKAAIMAYVNSLSPEEREALEQGFREHLAATVPAMVAKRFTGGETWCADPIIRIEATSFLEA